VGALGLSTPLIYGGGIRHAEDAVQVVNMGADRVSLDAMLWDEPERMETLARELGTQALIAHLPVRIQDHGLVWRNYRSGNEVPLNESVLTQLHLGWVSEVMLTDWSHEGIPGGFDSSIPGYFPEPDKPLLVFGGLSEPTQFQDVLSRSNVVAAGVGNFLSYKEHALQQIKRGLVGFPIRPAYFAEDNNVP
jgi:cyclase